MTAGSEIDKILRKEIAIHTYTVRELLENPAKVQQVYSLHAETHIPLGETVDFTIRVLRSITENKRVLTGGIVGDFGLGKTSYLIHLWKEAEEAGLVALPPFRWEALEEVFEAIASWAAFKTDRLGYDLGTRLREILSKYSSPALERAATTLIQEEAMAYNTAMAAVRGLRRSGQLKLGLSADDLFDFCVEIQALTEEVGFKGLLIIMDELQHTAEAISLAKLADLLFEVSSKSQEAEGKYGFVFGMPATTHAAIADTRRDTFDRLNARKALINLRQAYGESFASDLWKGLGKKLRVQREMASMVDSETLQSLDQLSSPKRPDIGCGPRTAVSAFSRVVSVAKDKKRPYTVMDLTSDCLAKEILLGEQSTYLERLRPILQLPDVAARYGDTVLLLAGFPDGCPPSAVEHYKLTDEVNSLLRVGFSDLVTRNVQGLQLIALRRPDSPAESYLDRAIKTFRNTYAADADDQARVVDAFLQQVVPLVLPSGSGLWSCLSRETKTTWHRQKTGARTAWFRGSFERVRFRYPNRQVQITVASDPDCFLVAQNPDHDGAFVAQFSFFLDCDRRRREQRNSLILIDDGADPTYLFRLNMNLPVQSDDLSIFRLIDRTQATPMFLLSLAQFLVTSENLPMSEEPQRKVLVEELINEVVYSLFSSDLQKVSGGGGLELSTRGRNLLGELFEQICATKFPEYSPIGALKNLERLTTQYVTILNDSRIPLEVKRGKEVLYSNLDDLKDRRKEIARVFGSSRYSSLEDALSGFGSLIEADWSHGQVYLRVHPMERRILDILDKCPEESKIVRDGVRCDTISPKAVLDLFMNAGYCQEEMDAILRIGVARRFFNHDSRTRLIYRKPLTVEEWRQDLRDLLSSIYLQLELVGEPARYDPGSAEEEILRVDSDLQYESVKRRLTHLQEQAVSELLSSSLHDLEGVKKHVSDLESYISQAQMVGGLFTRIREPITGAARWVEALNDLRSGLEAEFIGLRADSVELRREVKAFEAQILPTLETRLRNKTAETHKTVTAAIAGFAQNSKSLDQVKTGFESRAKPLLAWRTLLDDAANCQKLAQAAKAMGQTRHSQQLLVLNARIEEELRKQKYASIRLHEQYQKEFDGIRTELIRVITSARDRFNELRASLSNLLREIEPRTPALVSPFQDLNPEDSYRSLASEARNALQEALSSVMRDVLYWRNELVYVRDVLKVAEELNEELQALSDGREALQAAIEGIERLDILDPSLWSFVLDPVSHCRTAQDVVRKRVLELVRPGSPSSDEQRILDVLGDQEMDLKQLVVRNSRPDTAGMDLDLVLESVKSLFRKHRLQIRVKRQR